MNLTDYGELLALDLLLGGGQSRPDPVWIAACTAVPVDADTGSTITEPSGGSYARVSVANDATEWGPAASSSIDNLNQQAFPQATADWGVIRAYMLVDAATAGNAIGWVTVNTPEAVLNGSTLRVPVGGFAWTAD